MDDDFAISEANNILSEIIESRDPYEKIAIVLRVIPLESFDEAFRFFTKRDQSRILEALETPVRVSSIETIMVVREFISRNGLQRFIKTSTTLPEEALSAFQKYAGMNPRKISELLAGTWLKKKGK